MNIRKNVFLIFIIIFNIIFSGVCVNASEANTAEAVFASLAAQTYNMTASLVTGAKPVLETKDGITGWRLDASESAHANIRCDIDNNFMYNLSDLDNVTVEVTYYDDSYGGFALYYDAKGDLPKNHYVQLKNTGTWKTASFPLYDALFAGRINKSDFYILTNDMAFSTDERYIMGTSPYDILISSVKVIKEDTQSPFTIEAETGNPGNVFFEDERIIFDISFKSDYYKTANVSYIIRDYNGNRVFMKEAPFSGNKYVLEIADLKFGVYTLEIIIEDGNFFQSEIIDFSYSKKAQNTNKRFGTNIHFNWEVYDREDIRALADLAKNAGYHFIRSGVSWDVVEPEVGKYKIPDNYMYATKYVDKLGLEIVCILSCGNSLHTPWPYRCDTEEARQAYYEYCYYTVNALKDYTDYFTSPNEYNFDAGNGGIHIPEKYENFVKLVKGSYPYIKKANPDAFIVSGAVGRYEKTYIENCYDEGILDYCDAFSLHVYDYFGGPESWYIYPTMQWHTDSLKSRDSTKQSWITENGWPSIPGERTLTTANSLNDEKRQALYYPRALAINSNPDRIDTYINYCFVDNNTGYFYSEHNFGIMEAHDYRTPFAAKPAYISTAAFNSILDGYEYKCDLNHESGSYVDLSEINFDEATYEYGSDEEKKFSKNLSDAHFAYVFENKDGEEITMFWMKESAPEKAFTYESDKPYLEIYDVYGNKQVIENLSGIYTSAYSNSPVYIKGTDKINSGDILLKNTSSSWDIDENEKLNVCVKLPFGVKSGEDATLVMAFYNKDGKLISTMRDSFVNINGVFNTSFSAEKSADTAFLKMFLLDGFESIKPLVKTEIIPEFGDDINIAYSTDGNSVTLTGTLENKNPYYNMTVTAWEESVSKEAFALNFANSLIYQDMIKSDANGNYEITFKIPENSDNIRVQLSGRDFVMQKTLYDLK